MARRTPVGLLYRVPQPTSGGVPANPKCQVVTKHKRSTGKELFQDMRCVLERM